MMRTISGVVGGLIAWVVVVTLINIGLRHALPGYVAAEPVMAFTLAMLIARLAMAAVTSIIAGMVVRAIAPASPRAPLILGIIVLLLFLPIHVMVWANFPIWYHAVFLLTIIPLVLLGARLKSVRPVPLA